MLARCFSAAVTGIDGAIVEIEVSQTKTGGNRDVPISIVGLPDAAVRESRDRIISAFMALGEMPPRGFTVVNLAPADLPKEGAAFDLGIALGILAASDALNAEELKNYAVFGELALNGEVRSVRGVLPAIDAVARSGKVRAALVPIGNAREAALAAGNRIKIYAVKSLAVAAAIVGGATAQPEPPVSPEAFHALDGAPDLADVKGQVAARRALEIAAAGGHNLLMVGPPGTGKSMLAARLAGILPPMTLEETLETSRIHSVLGLLSDGEPILCNRPFRSPHHTISDAGLIGGGHDPRPGEISLAHNGVLFLDEFPEFKRSVLEALRQPLECGVVTVSRASGSCSFPARFMLCAAMNPCPCGRGDVELGCTCRPDEVRRYRKRISGPLLDRIDMQIDVRQLSADELTHAPQGESSAVVRSRVIAARQRQLDRKNGVLCNAALSGKALQQCCQISQSGEMLLRQAIRRFSLSPRAYDRILKVARTIADLAGSETLRDEHILEAVSYRKSVFLEQ